MSSNLWLLDAHCDSIWMRQFLQDKLDLTHSTCQYSPQIQDFLAKTFGFVVPPHRIHEYHVNFSRLKQGNVKALFLNVGDYDLLKSSALIDAVYMMSSQYPNAVALCTNSQEIVQAANQKKLAFILSAEGPCIFHGQLDLIRNWYRLGIRVINLTHGEGTEGLPENPARIFKERSVEMQQHALQISTSVEKYLTPAVRDQLYKNEKGLSKFGRAALKEMEKLNIVCDLSHANDAAFWQVLEEFSVKVCVTHSNCAKLCGHSRNLTEAMMKALAKRGGVMGLCFYYPYIDAEKPSLKHFAEHILYAIEQMGADHVGIGSDYDGVEPGAGMAIENPSVMQALWEYLDKKGVDHNTMKKIAHQNFLNLLG